DAQSRAWRLRHLAEDKRRLLDDARFLHLVPEIVAFAGPLPHPGEHRDTAVLFGDVVDQLHDQHGLADARAAEEPGLAAFRVRLEQIDDLDTGLEHLDLRRLLIEGRGGTMDGIHLANLQRSGFVHGLARDVDDAAERLLAYWNRDR